MGEEEQVPGSASSSVITDGGIYNHAEHGTVRVTGIWRRTQRLDTVQQLTGQELIVVRYVPGEDGRWIDEEAESLDDFLDAIE